METLDECQPWGITKYTIMPGSHITFQTDRAKIDLITNPHFGRMLFIDGVLQCAQTDEHIYHEAIVACAFSFSFSFSFTGTGTKGLEGSANVLIAGGAEGAVAREVLKFPNVKSITMVDWDKELIQHMRHKENDEPFSQGAFENPLLTLIHVDILEFLAFTDEIFNIIILDLLDPQDSSEVKWLSAVTHMAFSKLAYGGTLVLNAGGDYERVLELKELVSKGQSPSREQGSQGQSSQGNTYECQHTEIFIPSFQEIWYLITMRRHI